MGFRTGAYATIWEVKAGSGNFTDARISTSKKNKQTDQYETDFSGFVRLIGTAHQNANTLKERDRIKIGDCEATNKYDKDKKVTYTNYAIFSFEKTDGNNTSANSGGAKPSTDTFVPVPDNVTDEELPFN